MRKSVLILVLALAGTSWIGAQQRPAPAAAPQPMLTVDSIMRGPKLVGASPSAIRWAKDSSKIYFTWQKAADQSSATWVVNRDGTGLKQMTAEETRLIEVPRTGRFDRARRRLLVVESGDVVIYDAASGARRQVTRTSASESNPRWARNDTAVTFTRDGNLFIMALEATNDAVAFAQLTDIVTPADAAAPAAGGQRAGGAGQRGVGGGARGTGAATATLTDAQRLLAEQNRALIEFLRNQQGGRGGGGGQGGGQGARGGGAGATPPPVPIARLALTDRQNVLDLQLSPDEHYVWVGVNERPEGTARGQDVPNYVTASAYPEMIPGRSNVGDVQGRRLLAAIDVRANRTVWADASAFAGVERKAKPTDPDVPRLLNWTRARRVRRRRVQRRGGPFAGQQGPLVRHGRSGHGQGVGASTGSMTTRGSASRTSAAPPAAGSAAARASPGCRTTSGSCSCPRRTATCTSTPWTCPRRRRSRRRSPAANGR